MPCQKFLRLFVKDFWERIICLANRNLKIVFSKFTLTFTKRYAIDGRKEFSAFEAFVFFNPQIILLKKGKVSVTKYKRMLAKDSMLLKMKNQN